MKQVLFLASFLFLSFSMLSAQSTNAELSTNVKKAITVLKIADLNLSEMQLSRITSVLISEDQILQKNLKVLEGNKSAQAQRIKELKDIKINNLKGAMTEQQVQKFIALKLEDKL